MSKRNKKKSEQLGMAIGTASGRLRKMILFDFVQRFDMDTCFQCGELIEEIDNFSIEHPIPWLDSEDPVGLFFNLDNIAFSHLSCNIGASRKNKGPKTSHGTYTRYVNHKCRCADCNAANARRREQQRKGEKQTGLAERQTR